MTNIFFTLTSSTTQNALQIAAHDLEGNYSINNATVVVSLVDINDHTPYFASDGFVIRTNVTGAGNQIGKVNTIVYAG